MDRMHSIGLVLGTMMWVSCGKIPSSHPWHEPHDASVMSAHSPVNIVGGTLVSEGQWQAEQTLVLLGGSGSPLCTAVLIGPNQILTAAHCLDNPIPNLGIGYGPAVKEECTAKKGSCRHKQPVRDKSIKVISTLVHPKYISDTTTQRGGDYYDIGLVVFEGELPLTITPIADFGDFPTRTADLTDESNLVKTGYGTTSDHDETNATLRSVELNVARLDVKNRELEYQRKTAKGTCNGDSGGPGFVLDGGTPRLIGITSRGPYITAADQTQKESSCDEGNGIDTDARYYRAWLDCSASAMRERFTAEGFSIAALDVRVERADRSAAECELNRIESLAEAYKQAKKHCEIQKGHVYDKISGECV